MIQIDQLNFQYNDSQHLILVDINLKFKPGEFVLIVGPSGSGKSTLIRTLNALIPNFYGGRISGSVNVQDMNTFTTPTRVMAGKVGMIFQNPENQLFMSDVESEIAFGMENLNFSKKTMIKRMEEILDSFGITHLRKKSIASLSGGEKQKVAIASIIAMNPEILILDEPTAELDPRSAEDVLNLVQKINRELGVTVLLIEHRVDRVIQYADRIIVIDEGRIIADTSPRNCFYNDNGIDLENLGVTVPPVIKIFKEIRKKYPEITAQPLTVKECKTHLKELMEKNQPKVNFLTRKFTSYEEYQNYFRDAPVLVEIKDLSFGYNRERTILKNINLVIHGGEFISIIGRNGSGKTTLAKQIIGLLKPEKGTVHVKNEDISKQTVAQIARSVGYIFQNPSIQFYQDTLEEEIFFVLNNMKHEKSEIQGVTDDLLNQFGLTRYKNKYPRYLSIGEQQKAALATVLAIKPKILILDEPTHGMDYKQKDIFMKFLNEYRKQGNVVILISHDVETIAKFSERIILLSDGKIVMDDLKRNVLSHGLLFSPQIFSLIQNFEEFSEKIMTADEFLEVFEF